MKEGPLMSETPIAAAALNLTEGAKPADATSAGALLRQARIAAGLELEAVAMAMKVPVEKIAALEANDWQTLPDTVFTRALATSICRLLKLPAAQVLEKLPALAHKPLPSASGINAPFRESAARGGRGWALLQHLPLPVLIAVFALAVLGAALAIFLPSARGTGAAAPEDKTAPAVAAATSTQPQGTAAQSNALAAAVLTAASAVVPSGAQPVQVVESVPHAGVAVAGVAAAYAQSAQSAASGGLPVSLSASAPGAVSKADAVGFKTSAPAHLKVVDAHGTVLLRKQTAAGESITVSGALPLAVVVEPADVTQVEVRGQPFDLSRFTRKNVARFEVR
jgi:cytoskeleton protein RodZ